jgi:hypothetical protein
LLRLATMSTDTRLLPLVLPTILLPLVLNTMSTASMLLPTISSRLLPAIIPMLLLSSPMLLLSSPLLLLSSPRDGDRVVAGGEVGAEERSHTSRRRDGVRMVVGLVVVVVDRSRCGGEAQGGSVRSDLASRARVRKWPRVACRGGRMAVWRIVSVCEVWCVVCVW